MNKEFLEKYGKLIEQRMSNPLPSTEYGEKHHIKPRCVYPEEDKNPSNIIRLSAYEHFIAHYYLMRMYEDTKDARKLVHAFRFMNTRRSVRFTEEELHSSAMMYEEGKRRFSDMQKGMPGGMLGKRHTDESRKKMSEALMGHPGSNKGKTGVFHHSEETRMKLSEKATGRRASEEARRKMSESRKGRPGYMKGKHHSEETKQKISKACSGIPRTDEWKRKIAASKIGKPRSEETRRKVSEAKKGKPGHPQTEETKQKMREAWARRRELAKRKCDEKEAN